MTHRQQAVETFRSGFSCSQAVFAAFAEELGLDREKALRLSQPFGGGVARTGSTCGVVSGALLVIGLKHGRSRLEDEAAREKTYALVREFMTRFRERHGTLLCPELIGVDLGAPGGHAEAERRGVFGTICSGLVAEAVEILEALL